MNAEIIAIGNEVVDGSVVNTNASYLSQELRRLGMRVRFHAAVPDDEALMLDAFGRAQGRSQLVLVTGGLGPTVDDFTLEVAAKFFGKGMTVHEPSLARIRGFFSKLGRAMTPNQERQALFPEGGTVLENPVGSASGFYFQNGAVHWAFFPGVPAEMRAMLAQSLAPILRALPGKGEFEFLKVLRCFGLPEGQMDDVLRSELKGRVDLLGAKLGFRVRFPTVDIRLYALGRDERQAEEKLQAAEAAVREKLGEYIFGTGEETLEAVVGRLLKERRLKVAVAESCTGGLLASSLTDVPGASEYFIEGVVSYSNEAKSDLLRVRRETLESFGAVSRETALEMASGIMLRSRADIGIGVTGIAGPSGGSEEKPVGTVHIAVTHPAGEWEHRYFFPFGRERFKAIVVAAALDRVRRILLALPQ